MKNNNSDKQSFSIKALYFIIIALFAFCICTYISLKGRWDYSLQFNTYSSERIIVNQIGALNQRITDIYIWSGFFITIIVGGFILNWFNVKGIAKEQAESELKSLKDKYNEIEIMASQVESKLNSLLQSVEETENEVEKEDKEINKGK